MTRTLPPLVPIICAHPDCNNMIWITKKQKRELIVTNYLKYGDLSAGICCSPGCQQKLLEEYNESEFLTKGTIKNREYALVIQGCDVAKRPKEDVVRLIVGNTTEQQARCLIEELKSLISVQNKKTMTSNDVQRFLLTKMPSIIKPKSDKIDVTAWRVMNKCKELYPDAIQIERFNEKDRCIELIKSII